MAPTPNDITRLRKDVAATEVSLPDPEAIDIFAEAEEMYSSPMLQKIYARVIAIRRLMADAAKHTTYSENNASESMSDVSAHLQALLDEWQNELARMLAILPPDAGAGGGGGASQNRTIFGIPVEPVW